MIKGTFLYLRLKFRMNVTEKFSKIKSFEKCISNSLRKLKKRELYCLLSKLGFTLFFNILFFFSFFFFVMMLIILCSLKKFVKKNKIVSVKEFENLKNLKYGLFFKAS